MVKDRSRSPDRPKAPRFAADGFLIRPHDSRVEPGPTSTISSRVNDQFNRLEHPQVGNNAAFNPSTPGFGRALFLGNRTPPFPTSNRDKAEGINDNKRQRYEEFGLCQTKTSKNLLLIAASERL
jgi:hypothetical protein